MCNHCKEEEMARKEFLRKETFKTLEGVENESQVRDLVLWWWSPEQVIDRIKEEMDDNYLHQKSVEDLEDELAHIKNIAAGKVIDISQNNVQQSDENAKI